MLRVWVLMGVGAATLTVSALVATMVRAQAGADPAAVITAYEMARNRRDLDAAVAYFTDDATISQRTTTFSGKDEIRKFIDGISTRSRFVVVSDRHSSGNRVTWTERSGTQGPGQPTTGQGVGPTQGGQSQSAAGQTQAITGQSQSLNSALAANNATQNTVLVSVEAVVQDGKIRSMAYLTTGGPGRIDPSLEGRAQLPASAGLGAVLAVMLGMLMVGSLGLRRSAPGSSSLRGRLMHDLQGWTAARQSPSTG